MSSINNKDEQMEIHIQSRNKVLFELKQAYTKDSYYQTNNTDILACNVPEINEEACSPIIDDLLMEMNSRRIRNFEGNNNTDCYRCKHFLNIPPNLSGTYDKISDCVEGWEADLSFVQAIVWLKSATTSMKDVSVEQFHLIFHKQWSNNLDTRKNSEPDNSTSRKNGSQSLNSTIQLSDDEKSDTIFDNDLEYTSSIELLCDVKLKRNHDLSQFDQQFKERDEVFTGIIDTPSTSDCSQSLRKSFTPKKALKNRVIPDSDETHSSVSDIFKDSLTDEDSSDSEWNRNNGKLLEETDLIEELFLTSQDSNLLRKACLEVKCDFIITPNADAFSSESDTTVFDENPGQVSKSYKQINMQQPQASGKHSSLSLNEIDDDVGFEEDSDSDTGRLSGDYTSNIILQDEDLNKEIDVITPYRKDSAYDTYDFEIPLTNMISDENRLLSLSSPRESEHSVSQIIGNYNINRDTLSSSEDEYSRTDRIEDKEGKGKKRKLEIAYEMAKRRRSLKRDEEKISSKWLRFTLDASNADDVAFRSVKVILSVLQNDRLARRYMRKKCWKNTLEEEAVNAVLNFCDVFEMENKTTVCTQEIVQAVTNGLDKCIESDELNKIPVSIHQVSIVLELCNSAKVCIEMINYLTNKLKSYESTLIALMSGKKADVYDVMNQLHIIFYALNICLQKYRLIFPDEQHGQFEEETIPSVLDLWKKQLTFDDVMIEDKMKTRERRWLIILDDFMLISAENCSQFTDKLRMLISLITRE